MSKYKYSKHQIWGRDTRTCHRLGAWYVTGDSNGVLMFWERELNELGELHREFPIRCGSDLREGKFAVGMNTGETEKVELWKTGD